MKNLSTRTRIILLVILAALPVLAVTIYGSWDERERAVTTARKDMARLARLAAQQQQQIIEGSKQTLIAISLIPDAVRDDRARCNAYLATLLARSTGLYHSIGIYGADGVLQCDAVPWQGAVYSPDRLYYKLALTTGRFAVGEYQVGKVTKLPGINIGYPITNEQGTITGVAFIGLDLGSLNKMAEAVPLSEQGILTVLDRNGILLVHHPVVDGRVGNRLPFPDILNAVNAGRSGELTAMMFGGPNRLIAFDTVAVNPDGSAALKVVVSVPLSVVLADANQSMMRDIAGILVAIALLLIGAWYGAEAFVLRHFGTLLDVAKRVEDGMLSARTGLSGGKDELVQLGNAFDRMASALQARESYLKRAFDDLELQATTDSLTGLHNRRYLFEALSREVARARRSSELVAMIMIDIDHFKRVNDTYGHEAGDRVLKEVAGAIRAAVRASDTCCRYGGEEIALVLPDTVLDGARLRAETIRAAIEKLEIVCHEQQRVRVTVSLGVAIFPDHAIDADRLLRAADAALYEAKGAGRNRVVVYVNRGDTPSATAHA